jgi:hypothetical protein
MLNPSPIKLSANAERLNMLKDSLDDLSINTKSQNILRDKKTFLMQKPHASF